MTSILSHPVISYAELQIPQKPTHPQDFVNKDQLEGVNSWAPLTRLPPKANVITCSIALLTRPPCDTYCECTKTEQRHLFQGPRLMYIYIAARR